MLVDRNEKIMKMFNLMMSFSEKQKSSAIFSYVYPKRMLKNHVPLTHFKLTCKILLNFQV